MSQTIAFPVGRLAKPPISRSEAQRRAKEISKGMREQVRTLFRSTSPRPEPQQLFQDVTKGKTSTDESLLAAVVAGAANAHVPEDALLRFVNWFCVELISLRDQRPLPTRATLWMHDTEAEGSANVLELQFDEAVRCGNVLAVERAIEAKAAQLSSGYRLLTHMVAVRDDMKVRA